MDVIYYHRIARSDFHIHAYSAADMLYVPDEDTVIVKEQLGTFGGKQYTLTESKEILNEAKSIRKGKIPDKNAITFSNIKRFDYDGNTIKKLIKDIKLKKKLEENVKNRVDHILDDVSSSI